MLHRLSYLLMMTDGILIGIEYCISSSSAAIYGYLKILLGMQLLAQ